MKDADFDVVVIGAGPSGATLAALLRRRPALKVLVVEKENFPRDHIGESLVHLLVPVLQDSGALEKVLASECWIKKFGGIYAWDETRPSVTRFDVLDSKRDGVDRWSFHVDRAEFDNILLEHADSVGASVRKGVAVTGYCPESEGGTVTLSTGEQVKTRFVVDASGRRSNSLLAGRHHHLSEYRNVAIWNHYVNCRVAQDIHEDWNIYAGRDESPIANFAFEHGWVWFIPVPKKVDGKIVRTHSIGIVTDPEFVKSSGDLLKPDVFMSVLKKVPRLGALIGDAQPLSEEMHAASNYSMICEEFCDFDEHWISVGDAAYFVDPLFSSGVTFATGMAGSAAAVIRGTLDSSTSDDAKRAMWADYTREWKGIAQSFGLAIDQWYHAIAEGSPNSVYWKRRSGHTQSLGIRQETFQALVDTAITPDLMEVLTHGTHEMADLDDSGAFMSTLAKLRHCEPADDDDVSLGETRIVAGVTVDAPGFKVAPPPHAPPQDLLDRITEFWRDPIRNNDVLPCPYDTPLPCHRFVRSGSAGDVRFIQQRGEDGFGLYNLLKGGPLKYGQLKRRISPEQHRLLRRLVLARLLDVRSESRASVEVSASPA